MTAHNNPLENLYVRNSVNVHPNGASEGDEVATLKSLYEYDEETGLSGKPLFEDDGDED